MKSKIYEFDPVIYPFPIHITKDFDIEELKVKYKAVNANEEEVAITNELTPSPTTTARTVVVTNAVSGQIYYLILLFRPDSIGAGISAHEAMHLADAYLQYLGFSSPTAYDDEPYAYFVEWITNCMWSVLMDDEDKMKGKLIEQENNN